MLHRFVHEMDVEQPRRVGDGGMPAVENADLHMLIGRHIGHELHPDLLERRAAGREVIFQHPLLELFAEHRPGIDDAEIGLERSALARPGRRSDAIDHAVGEGHRLAHPLRQLRIDQLGQPRHGVLRHVAVAGDVVAAHHRERLQAALPPQLQAEQDQPEHRLRSLGVGAVGDDVRVPGIEALRGRVDIVAAFGDGQRDDANARVGQRFADRGEVSHRQEVDHRAGDAGARFVCLLLHHRGQVVLPQELFSHVGIVGAHAGADQRPVMVEPQVEQAVEIDRLVGAMKIADAEMHDTWRQRAALVAGHAGAGSDLRQVFGGEWNRHGSILNGQRSAWPARSKR